MNMEEDKERLRRVILEELSRLGVEDDERKNSGGGGTKMILGISNSNKTANSKSGKRRSSPRLAASSKTPYRNNNKGGRHSKDRDERRHTPKSPFASSKKKAEQRRNKTKEVKVFGRELGDAPSVCVYMNDGTQVYVPEFLVDVCNLIRRSINVEGIFRKAGSSQRQSDLKKLIDSGSSLPSSVHVIDGACLMKQFLRCLPQPLLSSDVHAKMIKCMNLTGKARIESIILCTLLLPSTHRHTLIYLMEFLSDVVASSGTNLMDARNLAIVLAPNMLPTTLPHAPSNKKQTVQAMPSEDTMLTTNIELLQLMIENGCAMGRMPASLALALDHQERSQSVENLATGPTQAAIRKKRRSASIHRLVTGLKRVVGHTNSSSPLRTTGSVEFLDTLHLHPGVTLSPMTPGKRKSADAFDMCSEPSRDGVNTVHNTTTPPSSKRPKVEPEVSADTPTTTAAATTTTTPLLVDTAASATPVSACAHLPLSLLPNSTPYKPSSKMVKPFTIREISRTRDVFGLSAERSSNVDDTEAGLKKSVLSRTEEVNKSSSANIHPVHNFVIRRSLDRPEPVGHSQVTSSLSMKHSQTPTMMSQGKRQGVKRRSCDLPIRRESEKFCNFGQPVRATRRSSLGWKINHCEPDGADVSTLGPRGVPDGAECILRDHLVPKPKVSSSLESLEQHYDDIKLVVKTMEAEVDKNNIQQMKETYFSERSTISAQNMSYSEMIQNAYERMKVEAKDIGLSPTDNMSNRLGKELKNRNRRSSEHRVIRSPSERKIGSIRRRSKELVQNAGKSIPSINIEESSANRALQTPKMKGSLMQTPVGASLRRGKPNSVKSGLPYVVFSAVTNSSESPVQVEETPTTSTNRTVVINKRNELTVPSADNQGHCNAQSISQGRIHDQVSSTEFENQSASLSLSGQSGDDSLEQLFGGPITRRKSSLLSSLSGSIPSLMIRSTDNSPCTETALHLGNCSSNSQNITCENMEVDDAVHNHGNDMETDPSQSAVLALPAYVVPSSEEQWLPAVDFINHVDEQECLSVKGNIGRPSLAALKKQKKVTANVQLFNNLQSTTPVQQRRQSRMRCTPHNRPPQRSAASERRGPRLSYSKSLSHRSTMTPREILMARQKSFQFDRSPHNLAKIAVVSPLKESTWLNIEREQSKEIPKPLKKECVVAPTHSMGVGFKTPVTPLTPIHGKMPSTPFVTPCETPVAIPPKLPPRAIARPSPTHFQYR